MDEANITASDFAIRVAGLPRKLTDEDHPHYAARQRDFGVELRGRPAETAL